MSKKKYDITQNTYERCGSVIKIDEQRYSSTHVSGGGSYTSVTNGVAHTTHTPVQSVTRHHQHQKIWLQEKDGSESSHELYNKDIDVREGHEICLIIDSKTRDYERFVNKTTGYYWRLLTKPGPTSFFAKTYQKIVIAFMSLFLAIPVINIFMMLAITYDLIYNKSGYAINMVKRNIVSVLFILSVCVSNYPFINLAFAEMKFNYLLPSEVGFTLSRENQQNFNTLYMHAITWYAETIDPSLIKNLDKAESYLENINANAKDVTYALKLHEVHENTNQNYGRYSVHFSSFGYTWVIIFFCLSGMFLYRHFMGMQKVVNIVSGLLDDRAIQILNNYDTKNKVDKAQDNDIDDKTIEKHV